MKGCLALLADVSKAQAARQVGQGNTYLIIIRDRNILCIPNKHVQEGEFVLGQVTEYQCTQGLTENGWHKIADRIAVAIRENRL